MVVVASSSSPQKLTAPSLVSSGHENQPPTPPHHTPGKARDSLKEGTDQRRSLWSSVQKEGEGEGC